MVALDVHDCFYCCSSWMKCLLTCLKQADVSMRGLPLCLHDLRVVQTRLLFAVFNSTGMASGGMHYMQNDTSLSVDGPVTDVRVRMFARAWLFNRATSRCLHLDSIECALAIYRAELHGRSGRLLRQYIIWEHSASCVSSGACTIRSSLCRMKSTQFSSFWTCLLFHIRVLDCCAPTLPHVWHEYHPFCPWPVVACITCHSRGNILWTLQMLLYLICVFICS